MAPQLLQTLSVGSNDNKDIVVRDDDKPPSIQLSLGIDAASSQPFSSQTIWYCGAPLKSMMDLESGRCRRTDGRKWRCRRDVIPDQKYCERHIHRGRQRSRKPVEVCHTTSESKSTIMNPDSIVKVNDNFPSAIKGNLENYSDVRMKKERSFDLSYSNNQSFEIKKRSHGKLNAPDYGNRVALEFGFSPNSVLQHGNVRGCGNSSNNNGSSLVVTESQRCRRTDGKKWRCSREVVPEQKYCDQHMHRGAKKVKIVQKSNTDLPFSIGTIYQQTCIVKNHTAEDDCDPNDVSVSSSSDATTISI